MARHVRSRSIAQVTLIDHSAKRVRIETSQGTLTADKVIVTVPTNLIADEAIRFHPPLPAKVDAARGLPLGLADKVTLALDEPEALPKEGNLRAATMRTAMGTYHIRPFGQPCIEGFFGGRFAQSLEDAGEGALRRGEHQRNRIPQPRSDWLQRRGRMPGILHVRPSPGEARACHR